MSGTKGADFDDFADEDFEGEDFAYIEDAAERRRAQKNRKVNKASSSSWRSVEDYMETRRLKNQLSDVFDDD